ncbi:hypothetical protein K2173_023096 [Erythroxylum novogranatense]|uniref:Thioredoxin domain-containing protein n=1 Tax=Erythroxylum novogranatense TaxID=1862640 RepID=A0AAV8T866_9ROSI|nr:hypothetical protein K2173_023096 [Erythroxylum novogranatense]
MAMKNCFQMTTVCNTTRAGVYHPFGTLEKPQFPIPTNKGKLHTPILSLSSSSSFFGPFRGRYQKSRIVCKAREALDQVQVVTESGWDELVIKSENPVLVEFWAPWCGPCRMIAPVIEELAKEYAGKISCYKVNTDDCPNIATKYSIRSIPTVLFFNKGERKESVIGAVPKSTLSGAIDKYV